MTIRTIGEIAAVSPHLYERSGLIMLGAEIDSGVSPAVIIPMLTARGGYVLETVNMYGRDIVYFNVDSSRLHDFDDLEQYGVYLIRDQHVTYPYQYSEALDVPEEKELPDVTDTLFLPGHRSRIEEVYRPASDTYDYDDNGQYTINTDEDNGSNGGGSGTGAGSSELLAPVELFFSQHKTKIIAASSVIVVLYLMYSAGKGKERR